MIVASLTALFALGMLMGVRYQKGRAWSIALGASNTVVGLVIIGIEAAASQ